MRVVRVDLGRVQEIFAAAKADLADKLHPDLLAPMLEVDDNVAVSVGDVWDGSVFTPYIPPPKPTPVELMNLELSRPGSVVRALAMVTFREVNKLRVKNGDAPYTLEQFKAAIAAELP